MFLGEGCLLSEKRRLPLLGSTSRRNSYEGNGTSGGRLFRSTRKPSPSGVQTNSVAETPQGGWGRENVETQE